MDAIKLQLLKIQQQLSGLSASQKMLTASLVAIMVMTLLWWGRFAGTAEMTPVLNQSLNPADLGNIEQTLTGRGIKVVVEGDKVLVPSDRKAEAVAMLAFSNALPQDSSAAWDEMTKAMTLFDSPSKTGMMHVHMRERTLSEMMRKYFPGVVRADVVVNSASERRVEGSLQPTASVWVQTKNEAGNKKQLAQGIASTVASAISGLVASKVAVTIDGKKMPTADANDDFGGDVAERIAAQETYYKDKIAQFLNIPSALVAVSADLETSTSSETKTSYDPAKSVTKDRTTENTTEETNTPVPQSNEPGVIPNAGMSLNTPAPAAAATSTIEKNRTESQSWVGGSVEQVRRISGKPTVVSASIRLPRSYIVGIYKRANKSLTTEPDDETIRTTLATEVEAVRKAVKNVVAVKADENIFVDTYSDDVYASNDSDTMAKAGVGATVTGHTKEIAIGALAVVSLFMVSMIVRKSSPAPVLAPPVVAASVETNRLMGAGELAGIVGGDQSLLDGIELDDESVRAQQMVEQVSTMVKEDPEAAATLVKRWMAHT